MKKLCFCVFWAFIIGFAFIFGEVFSRWYMSLENIYVQLIIAAVLFIAGLVSMFGLIGHDFSDHAVISAALTVIGVAGTVLGGFTLMVSAVTFLYP